MAGRRPLGEKPLTDAERQQRRQQKLVTFRLVDKAAFESAATRVGRKPQDLAAEIIDQWLKGAEVPPPPVSPEQIEVAAAIDARRRNLLAAFADILNGAKDEATLRRIEARIAILADLAR